MAKVWLTRSDIQNLIREETHDINDDWGSMFPDDGSTSQGSNISNALGQAKPHQKIALPPSRKGSVDPTRSGRPEVVQLSQKGRVRYAGPAKDQTASKPYSRSELSKGVDIEPQRPGIIDRLKGMFLGKKSEDPTKPAGPPRDVSAIRKQFDDYRAKYQASLKRPGDVERQRHLKSMMQKAHRAWREAGGTK